MSQLPSRLEVLRRQTGEARARYAALEGNLRRQTQGTPQPGDLFLLPATGQFPVEWAIVEADGSEPRLLAVPADANPVLGSADVAVTEKTGGGSLSLRCAYGVWLPAHAFDPKMRTGGVPREGLAQARHKLSRLEKGEGMGSTLEREVDSETEYRTWVREVLEPVRRAVRQTDEGARPTLGQRRMGLRNHLARAASILVALGLGLAAGLAWQRERGDEPVVNSPFKTLLPADAERGEPEAVTVPSGASQVLLLLNVAELDPYERYRLEVLHIAAEGVEHKVWSGNDVVKVGTSTLSITLPAGWPAGEYRFALYGLSEGQAQPLAEYAVRKVGL